MLKFKFFCASLGFVASIIFIEGAQSANCRSLFTFHYSDIAVESEMKIERYPKVIQAQQNGKVVSLEKMYRPIAEVTIVVPVYRELKSGNMDRLIRALADQTYHHFRVVFVVNNSPQVAEDKNHPIFQENQKTLEYLRYLRVPFKFVVLDHSTNGIEPRMGLIRQKGVDFAIRSSKADPAQHIIVNLDADTLPQPDYLTKVIGYYSWYDVDAVLTSLQFEVRDIRDPLLLRSYYKYNTLFQQTLLDRSFMYAHTGAGTPQLTARARTLLDVGGFSDREREEDFYLMYQLREHVYLYTSEAYTVTEDRARSDGFDARERLSWNQGAALENLRSQYYSAQMVPAMISPLAHWLDIRVQRGLMSFPEATNLMSKYLSRLLNREIEPDIAPDEISEVAQYAANANTELDEFHFYPITGSIFWGVIRDEYEHYGITWLKLIRTQLSARESAYLGHKLDLERQSHDEHVIMRIEALHALRVEGPQGLQRFSGIDPFIELLRDPKSALHFDVENALKNASSKSEFIEALEDRYTDYLLMFRDTPFRQDAVAMNILSTEALRAQNQPEALPTFERYIRLGY